MSEDVLLCDEGVVVKEGSAFSCELSKGHRGMHVGNVWMDKGSIRVFQWGEIGVDTLYATTRLEDSM